MYTPAGWFGERAGVTGGHVLSTQNVTGSIAGIP
jgi:hypothetical protein